MIDVKSKGKEKIFKNGKNQKDLIPLLRINTSKLWGEKLDKKTKELDEEFSVLLARQGKQYGKKGAGIFFQSLEKVLDGIKEYIENASASIDSRAALMATEMREYLGGEKETILRQWVEETAQRLREEPGEEVEILWPWRKNAQGFFDSDFSLEKWPELVQLLERKDFLDALRVEVQKFDEILRIDLLTARKHLNELDFDYILRRGKRKEGYEYFDGKFSSLGVKALSNEGVGLLILVKKIFSKKIVAAVGDLDYAEINGGLNIRISTTPQMNWSKK